MEVVSAMEELEEGSIFARAERAVRPAPGRVYADLAEAEVLERIASRRSELGNRLMILGHHYQVDDVIRFADRTGDSYALAKAAAAERDAEFVIFAGVHFMAESADILTGQGQQVILPDLRAGCTMADMANLDDVELAWDEMAACTADTIVPITYINSAANLKDFVGRRGGAVCTSSNAAKVVSWAFSQGQKLLFFPDQHLGRNTCFALGVPLDEMIVWDPALPNGGHDAETVARARVLLWKGHCSVHMGFSVGQIDHWRAERPDIRIIVHPECTFEVVQAADEAGSTNFIIETIRNSPPGTAWAVGTEINLVHRLRAMMPDRFIASLSPFQCLCATMYRIRPNYLLWVLDELAEGRVVNVVKVPERIAEGARLSLQRMIEITG
jgi:quinolinate synthase